jgi:Trk K+ transport system NAD-binding subunit/nucleotide-binding universal stress UspA family protein
VPLQRVLIVVGAGGVGQALVRAIPETWKVTVVDPSVARLGLLPTERAVGSLLQVEGDPSSRLVLQRAGLAAGVALAIVGDDDAVNREVARIARLEFEVEDVVCLLDDVSALEGVGLTLTDVVLRSTATATLVANRMSIAGMSGVPLGLGQGEILEVHVLNDSPAVGRTLADLRPRRWLVAAVYRGNALIVPHGDTIIAGGDRLLVVGEPDVVEAVAPLLRGGEAVFPQQFGRHLGTLGGVVATAECRWLEGQTHADGVIELDPGAFDPRQHADGDALSQLLSKHDIGAIALDPRPIPWLARLGLARANRRRFMLAARVPVLVARGTFPYKRILVSIGKEEQIGGVAGAAVDLARQCEASLSVLTVMPPSLSVGAEARRPYEDIPRKVAQHARMQGVEVRRIVDEGNPIDRIRHHAREHDLLIMGHRERGRHTLLTPDVSLFILHDAPCSTLFVPWNLARG